jgi:hypothetical protein
MRWQIISAPQVLLLYGIKSYAEAYTELYGVNTYQVNRVEGGTCKLLSASNALDCGTGLW